MARSVLAAFVLAMASTWATAQSSAWTPIGPDHATVFAAAHQPANGAVMLAGTYFGGLYRSTDWGYNWRPVDVPFSAASVFTVQWDARHIGRVFAGLFQEGVWRSDDAGLSWQKMSAGLSDGSVQALSIEPNSAKTVLAATPSGLFRSSDEGLNWSHPDDLAGLSTRAVAYDPTRPGTAYVGTNGRGVFRSTDDGASWLAIAGGSELSRVNSLSFDTVGNLYAATDAGVYQLPAGDSDWLDLRFNLPEGQAVNHVLAHPTAANVLFAGTDVGTYVISDWATTPNWFLWTITSTRFTAADDEGRVLHVAGNIGSMHATVDFGATWARADHGIQNAFIGGIATGLFDGKWRLLAGSGLGVSSLDMGQPWETVLPLGEGVFDIQIIGNTVYAGTEGSGVFKSEDAGKTWVNASNGIVPGRVNSLAFTADTSPTLLAATGSGVYRSTNGGQNWTQVRLPELSYAHTVAADPVRPPIVWIGTGGGRVYRSLDRGQNFSFAGSGLPAEDIVQLVPAPWSGVYALTAGGTVYSTIDNGASWFPTATQCPAPGVVLRVDPSHPWIVYLATSGAGMCKSESGGLAWKTINQGITATGLLSLWMNPGNPSELWAGGIGRVFHTVDGGALWQKQTTGLPGEVLSSLVGDAADSQRLYALAYGKGVYESRDAGTTWVARSSSDAVSSALTLASNASETGRLFAGTPNRGVQISSDGGQTWVASNTGMSLFARSIAIDPGDASTLYAGTLGGGLFRSHDGAASWINVGLTAGNLFRVRSPSSQRVIVGTSNGVAESLDGGTTWADLGQRVAFVQSMVADPADPRHVLVGGTAGEIRAGDGVGARWQDVRGKLPAADVLAMATCPDGTVLAAPERAGVWLSNFSKPEGWVNPGSIGLGQTQVVGLACDPRSGFFYAATNAQGVWLSVDRGVGWTAINQGLAGNIISAVLPSPNHSWEVWAAVRDGMVYRSQDAGLNWINAGAGLPSGGVSQLTAGPDETLYAGTAAGVYRRDASGLWSVASAGLPLGLLTALWADPSRPGIVLAAVAGAGLYGSTDGAASWAPVSADTQSADVTTVAGTGSGPTARIYAGTQGTGVTWSTDGGQSFGQIQSPASMPQVVLDIAFDAVDSNTMYLASGGQGLLVTRNAGSRWQTANNGLDNLKLLSVAAHPTRAGELYAGGNAGVFVSRDYGATWTTVNSGLVNRNATALHFDTLFPDTLYVGIEGGGTWFMNTSLPGS